MPWSKPQIAQLYRAKAAGRNRVCALERPSGIPESSSKVQQ